MQSLTFTWADGKGCTLTIDGVKFERSTESLLIKSNGNGPPDVTLQLSSRLPLTFETEKSE